MSARKNAFYNYSATSSLIVLSYLFYSFTPYTDLYFYRTYHFGIFKVDDKLIFIFALYAYLSVLWPYYSSFPDNYKCKNRLFWQYLFYRKEIAGFDFLTVALSNLIKFIFLPLMLTWFCSHIEGIYYLGKSVVLQKVEFANIFYLVFHIMITIDIFWFMIGYGIEHPSLNNEIKSVDRTVLGWGVALICYPPFSELPLYFLENDTSVYPEFGNLWIEIFVGIIILALFGIYTWATVALGSKASNLTNRGIISKGPYAYVRHPAYICKNTAWWICSIPLLFKNWEMGLYAFSLTFLGIIFWPFIYYLRAITEERHLISDPDYMVYCQKIKKRFIPYVF